MVGDVLATAGLPEGAGDALDLLVGHGLVLHLICTPQQRGAHSSTADNSQQAYWGVAEDGYVVGVRPQGQCL